MAKPQIEDGYVRIATELFEAMCRIRLKSETSMVFLAIIRLTYGFNKSSDKISLTQISDLTKMDKKNICRAVKLLESKQMIFVNRFGRINNYKINKDFECWSPQNREPQNREPQNREPQNRESLEGSSVLRTTIDITKDTTSSLRSEVFEKETERSEVKLSSQEKVEPSSDFTPEVGLKKINGREMKLAGDCVANLKDLISRRLVRLKINARVTGKMAGFAFRKFNSGPWDNPDPNTPEEYRQCVEAAVDWSKINQEKDFYAQLNACSVREVKHRVFKANDKD